MKQKKKFNYSIAMFILKIYSIKFDLNEKYMEYYVWR